MVARLDGTVTLGKDGTETDKGLLSAGKVMTRPLLGGKTAGATEAALLTGQRVVGLAVSTAVTMTTWISDVGQLTTSTMQLLRERVRVEALAGSVTMEVGQAGDTAASTGARAVSRARRVTAGTVGIEGRGWILLRVVVVVELLGHPGSDGGQNGEAKATAGSRVGSGGSREITRPLAMGATGRILVTEVTTGLGAAEPLWQPEDEELPDSLDTLMGRPVEMTVTPVPVGLTVILRMVEVMLPKLGLPVGAPTLVVELTKWLLTVEVMVGTRTVVLRNALRLVGVAAMLRRVLSLPVAAAILVFAPTQVVVPALAKMVETDGDLSKCSPPIPALTWAKAPALQLTSTNSFWRHSGVLGVMTSPTWTSTRVR
jgi:hypothetical protein